MWSHFPVYIEFFCLHGNYIDLQLTHRSISEWLKENFYYNKSTLISFVLMSEGQELDSTRVTIVQGWRVYLYSWLWRTNILICNLCPDGEKYLIWTFSNILDSSDILSKKKKKDKRFRAVMDHAGSELWHLSTVYWFSRSTAMPTKAEFLNHSKSPSNLTIKISGWVMSIKHWNFLLKALMYFINYQLLFKNYWYDRSW